MMDYTPPPALVEKADLKAGYLSKLESLRGTNPGAEKKKDPWNEAVREAALSLGTRAGLAWETARIDRSLSHVSADLSRMFDFQALTLADGRVIPPVILSTRDAQRLSDSTTLRRVEVSWHIRRPAILSTGVTDWRTYLVRYYAPPNVSQDVPNVLLPKTAAQRNVWKAAVARGFQIGVSQAREIFRIDLRRARRDILGQVRFHVLALGHIVSVPAFAQADLGVEQNGDRMDAGIRVTQITRPTAFRGPRQWKATPYRTRRAQGRSR